MHVRNGFTIEIYGFTHRLRTFLAHAARNDVINFHLSSFFRGFYFCGSRSVRENRENLHPVKISRYTVTVTGDDLRDSTLSGSLTREREDSMASQ